MALEIGSRVGPYKITAEIGAGGMGVVYRARDSRLGRDVAIKVSAERFTERFEREARAVAALNHPNICTLHDVGPDYLVMELVEGETLADAARAASARVAWHFRSTRRCASRARSRRRSMPRTRRASSIAISSRATSRSRPTAPSRCSTSASRK